MYIKVDRKSKKEKDKAVAWVLVSKGYDNFINPATDSPVFANVKTFLQSLTNTIASNNLGQQIAEQEAVVKKEEKRLENYQGDLSDIEKRIRKLNDDMEEKKKAIEDQKAAISRQQALLQVLKEKKI